MPFQLRLRGSVREPRFIDLGAEFLRRKYRGTKKQEETTNVLYRGHGRILDALSWTTACHFPVSSLPRAAIAWDGLHASSRTQQKTSHRPTAFVSFAFVLRTSNTLTFSPVPRWLTYPIAPAVTAMYCSSAASDANSLGAAPWPVNTALRQLALKLSEVPPM